MVTPVRHPFVHRWCGGPPDGATVCRWSGSGVFPRKVRLPGQCLRLEAGALLSRGPPSGSTRRVASFARPGGVRLPDVDFTTDTKLHALDGAVLYRDAFS